MVKTIAFVPVREGSKSIPLKNIKDFCGKPLVYWVLKALNNAVPVDRIVVATDSIRIEATVQSFRFDKVTVYRRSTANATDTASTESVMLEYLAKTPLDSDDIFMLVQATSPLTETYQIEEAFEQYHARGYDSMLTCVRLKRFLWNPDGSALNYTFTARPRRQDFAGSLMENGAFYISRVGAVMQSGNRLSGRIGIYEMPEHTAAELDHPDDWISMEQLMRKYVLSKIKGKKIKLFLTDVDGVMTDAGMYYSENGDEMKKFNSQDGLGMRLLRESGIRTGIITTETTKLVERRAAKLKVDYLSQGRRDGGKLEAAMDICQKEGISLEEVAYIGDDMNCIELLSSVGYAACPANAVTAVKSLPGIIILQKRGGDGAVREFAEWILNLR